MGSALGGRWIGFGFDGNGDGAHRRRMGSASGSDSDGIAVGWDLAWRGKESVSDGMGNKPAPKADPSTSKTSPKQRQRTTRVGTWRGPCGYIAGPAVPQSMQSSA